MKLNSRMTTESTIVLDVDENDIGQFLHVLMEQNQIFIDVQKHAMSGYNCEIQEKNSSWSLPIEKPKNFMDFTKTRARVPESCEN